MTSEAVRRSIKAPRPLLLLQGASIYVYHIHISITINYNFDKKNMIKIHSPDTVVATKLMKMKP